MEEWLITQYHLCKSRNRLEDTEPMTLRNLMVSGSYEVAEYNRVTSDLSLEEKSERLWTMMSTQPVQNMICKENVYRSGHAQIRKEGRVPYWYKLFDGCHRHDLTRDFLEGRCYVKIRNPNDDCDYYCWNTQEALGSVDSYHEYHLLIPEEWRRRLLDCKINMIRLDPQMSDTEAYQRARVANQCKPLSNAQIMKCMCAKKTVMAKLLGDMNLDDDELSNFLDDDIFRYNVSIIRMFVEHSFDCTFTTHIAMLQGRNALERAEILINDEEKPHDDLFVRKVLDATKKSRSIVTAMMKERVSELRKTDHTQQSAIGLIYFTLALACANANESVLTTEDYICKESAAHILDLYLGLDTSEKGENHKRFYTYFTTGTFPTKKRKAREDED